MMEMDNQAKKVCTIHLWRVAGRKVDEIHHARMRAARAQSPTRRMRPPFRVNHDRDGSTSSSTITPTSFSSVSPWGTPFFSLWCEAMEPGVLFSGLSPSKPAATPPKVIASVYSLLPIVEKRDRGGQRSWAVGVINKGERPAAETRGNDAQH